MTDVSHPPAELRALFCGIPVIKTRKRPYHERDMAHIKPTIIKTLR
jgi:hypothetical protein